MKEGSEALTEIKNFEDLLIMLRDERSERNEVCNFDGPILESIHVIGFHHKQGSIVEFSYPENTKNDLLAYLALPDCVHNADTETFFFTLQSGSSLKHCVSCFCQVPNLYVTQQMNRNFVQKAVVAVSNKPYYGLIAKKLETLTQVYFDQKNFTYTQIIVDGFGKMQKDLNDLKLNDLYLGINSRMLVRNFKTKVLNLMKLVLFQGRIIVFSKTPSLVSGFIYTFLSLFPGQLNFGRFDNCPEYQRYLEQFGLPLSLFNQNFCFHSYFSIFQLNELEKPGYLIGCTNQMIAEHPRSAPHAVVYVDTGKIKFQVPGKMKDSLKASSAETKFIKETLKSIELSWNKSETWLNPESNHSSHIAIINSFHKFLLSALSNIALLRQKLQGNPIESILKLPKKEPSHEYSQMNSKIKKTKKYKKFLKSYKNKFYIKWANHSSFKIWLQTHPCTLAYLSEFCGEVQNCEIKYEKGEVYRGAVFKGKRHGKGIFLSSSYKYEGNWSDDKKSGHGILTSLIDKYVYDGNWIEDEQNGQGFEVKSGTSYTGSFVKGKYYGNGMIAYNDSTQYNGEWINGIKQGMGHWYNQDGECYKGEFDCDLFHGQGQFTFADGNIYNGQFVKGKINGKGEYLYGNGEIFVGEFTDGVNSAVGQLVASNGDRADGVLIDGKFNKRV